MRTYVKMRIYTDKRFSAEIVRRQLLPSESLDESGDKAFILLPFDPDPGIEGGTTCDKLDAPAKKVWEFNRYGGAYQGTCDLTCGALIDQSSLRPTWQ